MGRLSNSLIFRIIFNQTRLNKLLGYLIFQMSKQEWGIQITFERKMRAFNTSDPIRTLNLLFGMPNVKANNWNINRNICLYFINKAHSIKNYSMKKRLWNSTNAWENEWGTQITFG